MTTIRIAVDARELTGKPTGVGRYLSEILKAWGELPAASAHEFILCASEPLPPARVGNLRTSSIVANGDGTQWEQLTLPRLVRASRADVLFAPAYTAPLWCRAPIVVTIHDVSFAAHPEWFSWREGLRRRVLTRRTAAKAARVITDSDFSKREIVRHLGVDQGRIDVIYPGTTAFAAAAAREPLVLYVGSIFNRRHVPELIEGFARLAARHPDARLEIVGDNRTEPHVDLAEIAARSGAGNRIRLRSYVSEEEISALYGRASAFAFLSDYEGFGLTPLEALASGTPVVVLDTEVARETCGPAAVYLDRPDATLIAEALERVLVDERERTRLLQAAQMHVARYSWSECAHRTLQVLLACAGR